MKDTISINATPTWSQVQADYKKIDEGKMGRYVKLEGDKVSSCSFLKSLFQDLRQLLRFSLSDNVYKPKQIKFKILENYCQNAKFKDLYQHISDIKSAERSFNEKEKRAIASLIETRTKDVAKTALESTKTASPDLVKQADNQINTVPALLGNIDLNSSREDIQQTIENSGLPRQASVLVANVVDIVKDSPESPPTEVITIAANTIPVFRNSDANVADIVNSQQAQKTLLEDNGVKEKPAADIAQIIQKAPSTPSKVRSSKKKENTLPSGYIKPLTVLVVLLGAMFTGSSWRPALRNEPGNQLSSGTYGISKTFLPETGLNPKIFQNTLVPTINIESPLFKPWNPSIPYYSSTSSLKKITSETYDEVLEQLSQQLTQAVTEEDFSACADSIVDKGIHPILARDLIGKSIIDRSNQERVLHSLVEKWKTSSFDELASNAELDLFSVISDQLELDSSDKSVKDMASAIFRQKIDPTMQQMLIDNLKINRDLLDKLHNELSELQSHQFKLQAQMTSFLFSTAPPSSIVKELVSKELDLGMAYDMVKNWPEKTTMGEQHLPAEYRTTIITKDYKNSILEAIQNEYTPKLTYKIKAFFSELFG